MQQSPKHIIKNFKNRNISFGKERRLNAAKRVVENEPHFPKPLQYEDIDLEMFKWVDTVLDISHNGQSFKTYKLFSNQRISEYGQTWQNLDEKGNLDINFKTITRESNPQKGTIYGGACVVPGNLTFPVFKVRALDENGVEYTEVYSMRQPVPVDLIYTIGVFANEYKTLNLMNTKIQKEFKSLTRYIFPNGYALPTLLNAINDESEYVIDDRKYYSQTFQIKVLGYVISEDDFVVTKEPSRSRLQFTSGRNASLRTKKEKFNINSLRMDSPTEEAKEMQECIVDVHIQEPIDPLNIDDVMNTPSRKVEVEIEELCGVQVCWENTEDEFYVNKKVVIDATFDHCSSQCEFISQYHLGIESMELKNVKAYKIFVDNILVNIEDSDVEILQGDSVRIEVESVDLLEESHVRLVCYDLDSVIVNDPHNAAEIINV